MIQMSKAAAEMLVKLLNDVEAVDTYAHCSDKFFRNHFREVVLGANANSARMELERALPRRTSQLEHTQPTTSKASTTRHWGS